MTDVERVIGIVAGAGPYAGLDLLRKILEQTVASSDQEHLPIVSISKPSHISDRTNYLQGKADINPAHAIAKQLLELERMGAAVAGIPCNTAHAAPIFEVILQELSGAGSRIELLHMMREVADFLGQYHPKVRRVGILATMGTYQTRLYPDFLEPWGFNVFDPAKELQQAVHDAIYDPIFGIKANGFATDEATAQLSHGANDLNKQGAEVVVLGCTELPLAIKKNSFCGMPVVDPTSILARALIREANPGKLKLLEIQE
jgi:aspartate racemase